MPDRSLRPDDIARLRLRSQLIDRPGRGPAEVVAHLCAMQAQDYLGALWSVGLRCEGSATDADVVRAIEERTVVRTWPMRGTLHFVAAADVRWMLELLTPRVVASRAGRFRQLELTDRDFERSREIFVAALSGGRALTRAQLLALLESHGVDTSTQRGYHLLGVAAQLGLLCLGPMKGRQQTFVLLDEWVPPTGEAPLDRPEALARLAARYVAGHAPAAVADLAWWAGITKGDARAGLEAAADLERITVEGAECWLPAGMQDVAPTPDPAPVYLLPSFDEYFLGYTDRSAQLGDHARTWANTISSNGVFWATFVIGGVVAGRWKRTLKRTCVEVSVHPWRKLSAAEKAGVGEAAERYGRFLGVPAKVEIAPAA